MQHCISKPQLHIDIYVLSSLKIRAIIKFEIFNANFIILRNKYEDKKLRPQIIPKVETSPTTLLSVSISIYVT